MPDSINTLAQDEKDVLVNLKTTSVNTNSDEDERAESHKAEVKAVLVEARITLEESPQEIDLRNCNIDMDLNDDSSVSTLIDEVCTRDIGVIENSNDVFVDLSSATGDKCEAIEIEVSKFMSYDDIIEDILSERGDRHGGSDTISSMTSKASTAVASHKTHEVKKFENVLASVIEPDFYLETIEVAHERTVSDNSALCQNRILVFRKQQLENASTVEINCSFDTLPSLSTSVSHGDESTLSDKGSGLDDIVETDVGDDDSFVSKSSYRNDEFRLMPCGIPQEEIMEDLFDAFHDTKAHIKSQLLWSFCHREGCKKSRGRARTSRIVRQERKNQLSSLGRRVEL